MGMEDVFNCAKSAMTFYDAYLKTVAEEIGMDRALSLHTKMFETIATMQGEMIKEQSGTEEIHTKAAWSLAKSAPESLGISMEVLEESPRSVVFKVGKCPIDDAAQMMGVDAETIETLCRSGPVRFMDAMTKQLNPNFSYKLQRFRSGTDDFCEEVSVLLKTGEAFVGDMAMNKFPLRLSPGLPIYAENWPESVNSWQLLLNEGIKTVYSSHGGPFLIDIIKKN